MIKYECINLKTEDHIRIALWKVSKSISSKNIFLTHGTFSDKKICLGIAEYFVKKGYNCWVMEWRNHGSSQKIKSKFNFETIALFDLKTAENYLINQLKISALQIVDERYYTMKQWFDWNIKNNFIGGNNFNYFEKMKTIEIPIYSICSEADTFISPKKSCEIYIKSFENKNNKYQCFSLSNGNLEDYGHSRVLLSKNARKEIWEQVYTWIAMNEN